tara:strand:+ start:27 stop:224 length:198 start_codon:yes stop_codon:yes gene_type:complete
MGQGKKQQTWSFRDDSARNKEYNKWLVETGLWENVWKESQPKPKKKPTMTRKQLVSIIKEQLKKN